MQQIWHGACRVIRYIRKPEGQTKHRNQALQFYRGKNSVNLLDNPRRLWISSKSAAMFKTVLHDQGDREAEQRLGSLTMQVHKIFRVNSQILDGKQRRIDTRQICDVSDFVTVKRNKTLKISTI